MEIEFLKKKGVVYEPMFLSLHNKEDLIWYTTFLFMGRIFQLFSESFTLIS